MLAQEIAPVQPKAKVRKAKKAKKVNISLVSTIERLKSRDELVGNSITFHFLDGSRKVQTIGKQFVISENGRYLPTHLIIENMNALLWDAGADSYSID